MHNDSPAKFIVVRGRLGDVGGGALVALPARRRWIPLVLSSLDFGFGVGVGDEGWDEENTDSPSE